MKRRPTARIDPPLLCSSTCLSLAPHRPTPPRRSLPGGKSAIFSTSGRRKKKERRGAAGDGECERGSGRDASGERPRSVKQYAEFSRLHSTRAWRHSFRESFDRRSLPHFSHFRRAPRNSLGSGLSTSRSPLIGNTIGQR